MRFCAKDGMALVGVTFSLPPGARPAVDSDLAGLDGLEDEDEEVVVRRQEDDDDDVTKPRHRPPKAARAGVLRREAAAEAAAAAAKGSSEDARWAEPPPKPVAESVAATPLIPVPAPMPVVAPDPAPTRRAMPWVGMTWFVTLVLVAGSLLATTSLMLVAVFWALASRPGVPVAKSGLPVAVAPSPSPVAPVPSITPARAAVPVVPAPAVADVRPAASPAPVAPPPAAATPTPKPSAAPQPAPAPALAAAAAPAPEALPVAPDPPAAVAEPAPIPGTAPAPAPAPPDLVPLNGKWNGTVAGRPMTLSLSQSGGSVSGSLDTQVGPRSLKTAVSGSAVANGDTWKVVFEAPELGYQLTGTMGAGSGGGQVMVRGKTKGDWVVSR